MNIKPLRLALGLTVTDTARKLGVSRSTYHRWERDGAPEEAYNKLKASRRINAEHLDALIKQKEKELDALNDLAWGVFAEDLEDDN